MVGVFAAATARLTPEFLESFDPEKLASKFVKVEREFGVKFTKTKSTFNIIGHWEAVRSAHKSLLKLRTNAKCPDKSKRIDSVLDTSPENLPDCKENYNSTEAQSSNSQPPLIRGKGNPRKGRHATNREDPTVPAPVFFVQYQDKTFTDADSLDMDSVLEDFEKSQLNKKVSKEDLKKIFEKNKDQMGKPLEKGIPKGAIIPVQKPTKETCGSFASDPTTPVTATEAVFMHSDQTFSNSLSHIKTEPVIQSQIVNSMGISNVISSEMITTYSVNARMSTYNMEMLNNNQQTGESTTAVSQIKAEDFYYHTVNENNRIVADVFTNGSSPEQVQLSESETDSFCGMFDTYDPQSVLNPIPSSTSSMTADGTRMNVQLTEIKRAVYGDVERKQDEAGDTTIQLERSSCLEGEKTGFTSTSLPESRVLVDKNVDSRNGHEEIPAMTNMQDFTGILQNSIPLEKTHSEFINISMASKVDGDMGINQGSVSSKAVMGENNANIVAAPSAQITSNGREFIEGAQVPMTGDRNSFTQSGSLQNLPPSDYGHISESNAGLHMLTYALLSQERASSVVNDEQMSISPEDKQVTISEVARENETLTQSTAVDNTGDTATTQGLIQHIDHLQRDSEVEQIEKMTSGEIDEHGDSKDGPITREDTQKEREHSKNKKIKKSKTSNVQDKTKTVIGIKKKQDRKLKNTVTDSKDNEEVANKPRRATKKVKDLETAVQSTSESQSGEESTVDAIKEKEKRKLKQTEEKTSNDIKEKQLYKCTECDYQGYRKKRLTEHMGRVHGLMSNGTDPENLVFSCNECKKSFVFEKDLNRHKKIVHHGQVFVCLICNKTYKSKYVFDRHTATHKEGYIQPKFKCQICEREFTTKFSLSCHIKSEHLGMKKTYCCPTCGKTFSQMRSYRQHANVHAGIRPYTCEICGKSFTYDKSLKEHRYMHDTVRRFQCTVCHKAFRQQTCLLIHMKTHKEKKDHICSVCGREFTQKQSLLRHERIHSGDKPYWCKICFKSFGDYAVIRKHVMMAHKKSKDSWKNDIFTEEKKRSSHYIEGGPGYVPRESYTKLQQKTDISDLPSGMQAGQIMLPPQILNNPTQQVFGQSLGEVNQTSQSDIGISASNQTNLNGLPNMYQTPAYSDTLEFSVMEALKQEQDNLTEVVPVNYSLVQSVGADAFSNIGQQQNLPVKSNLYSVINPALKPVGAGGDAYVAQFLNSPASVPTGSVEPSLVSMSEVPGHMLNSVSNAPVAIGNSTVSSADVTMATSDSSWMYPGYSASYFSPASFSQYQSSPDN